MSTSGPCTEFPAPGLRTPFRYMSGHNATGESVFIKTDNADHRSVMLGGAGAQAVFYSSDSNPIDLNHDVDLEFIKNQPSLHIPNGCVVRMVDFAPGTESTLHRALALSIGTVCEGAVELSLDSGEKRILQPGDVSVNRGAMHRWRNTSKEKPARMLFVMLDVKPIVVNGKTLEFEMGKLMDEYAKYKDGEGPESTQ
ncbi:hypothetical protein F5Y14DRAFT_452360 [Nemania sp. NC0429]|nr:hypothetical protein F5Y14DRAFT_452360 [Nemania sp. NC0429]